MDRFYGPVIALVGRIASYHLRRFLRTLSPVVTAFSQVVFDLRQIVFVLSRVDFLLSEVVLTL
jgi:hypothetical protein